MSGRRGTWWRALALLTVSVVMMSCLTALDGEAKRSGRQDRLYFPSGRLLVESSVGFREVAADYLWFRFIQYFGAYAKGENDLRYFDLLIDAITKLDPRFEEAYHFASLVAWSEFGDFDKSLQLLKRGILANPDSARLHFQVGFTYYVFYQDYPRSAHWFEASARCSDGGEMEKRFAAFARYRAGDDRVSLELWQQLARSTDSPQMQELAAKMIRKLELRLEEQRREDPELSDPLPGM